ncbi:MAG: AMP-binding protein, partial [Desulfotomaculales bacterium]
MAEVKPEEIRMIRESKLYYPDPEMTRKTALGSVDAFNALLRRSWEDPAGFWADVASELTWIKPWEKTMEGKLPHFKFFSGGVMNPCYNLLDRHMEKGAGNRLALIWEGENYETKFYTYRMLLAEVNKFANVLKGFGLKKGDRVAIYLPNLAETVVAVLACYRLGVLFNTVFSGFSVRALRDRLVDYEPHVIVTCDAGYRRGNLVPLKSRVDEATAGMAGIKAVIVVKRAGTEVNMQKDRDYWWDELMEKAPVECPPEPMEANEPGLVFYTSGTTG